MTASGDRGFSEATDMYYEITEAIDNAIEVLKTPPSWGVRALTGTPRRLYDIIIETRIDMCREIQEIVDDVYAKHDDADYVAPGQ